MTDTLSEMVGNSGAAGARFMTSQHWRLHQEYPEALAEATKPFADLVQRELEEARAADLLTPRDPERDAWLINRLVMSVFHHYAFADGRSGRRHRRRGRVGVLPRRRRGQPAAIERRQPSSATGSNSRCRDVSPRRIQVGS